jgi:gluconate 2-dehydrogenase gamma chain
MRWQFFSGHEAAVIEAATARIAPGPEDDPAEAGHPGAREAGVTHYIDGMLGALDTLDGTAPMIFAGGPWSDRNTPGAGHMASFMPLDPVARIAWRSRLDRWRQQYRQGIAALDAAASCGDFTQATHADQDKILAGQDMDAFRPLLFEHTIEGLYANPEYGGNRGLAGWRDIGYPGDVQPRGYTAGEVELSDGPDPLTSSGIVADALKFLGEL